jgi:hypothetical protein
MAIMPTRRTLTNQPPVQLINLGYATFDAGATNQFFIETGGNGSVMLTNHDVVIFLFAPYALQKSSTLSPATISSRNASSYPKTSAYTRQLETNPISAQMVLEEMQPLPFYKILIMNKDDFLMYSLAVAHKATMGTGFKQVEFFQSHHMKGVVYTGENHEKQTTAVHLSTLDNTKSLGIHLWPAIPGSTNYSDYLDPILRSFCFTAENVEDREAIKALIRDAGIPQRKQAPQDEE